MALDLGTLAAKVTVDDSEFQSKLRQMPSDGAKAGNDFATRFKAGSSGAAPDLSKFQTAVTQAAAAAAAARRRQEDADGRVRVAEAKLADAIAQTGESSTRSIAATEALAAARRNARAATESSVVAARRLQSAQTDLFNASRYRAAGSQIGESLRRGMTPGLVAISSLIAGLGIAQLTGSLLGFGMRTAMTMEKANISFTTLLGSGKKAMVFMAQLKQFAATTPFEFTELQGSASQLLAAGISASKVIPIMTTLGNVTSGMGTGSEGIRRAVVALQQMNAAGKIQAEDLNQLRDAGIPVYDLLAAATGKSKKEIAKLAQEGKLGAKELKAMMKALETGKGLERFNGLMDKQSQSLEGIISTLKDTVGQGLADALTPMIPDIKKGIADFTNALPGILSAVQGFFGWISANQDLLKNLGMAIAGAAVAVGVMTAAMWLLNVAMSANPVGIIILAIAGLVAGLVWAYNNVKWFRTLADAAFKVVGGAAMWLWKNAIEPAFQAIGAVAVWLWNNMLGPQLKLMLIGFANVADAVAGFMSALSVIPGFEWAGAAAQGLHDLATAARQASDEVQGIPDPNVRTGKSRDEVAALDKQIKDIKGKIVTAKAKGDDKEVDRLQKKLRELKDKRVKVLANVQKTGVTTITLTKQRGASGLSVRAYAAGGQFLPGWALVGEQGPELVKFAGAGRVYTAGQTRKMLAAQPPQPSRAGTTLNVTNIHPVNEPASVTTNRALAFAASLGGK